MAHIIQYQVARAGRLWIKEALLVAAILGFGGYALLSDARVTPSELLSGLMQFLAH